MRSIENREVATILAALRVYQTMMEMRSAVCQDVEGIATDGGTIPDPLSTDEIDDLCETINFGGLKTTGHKQRKPPKGICPRCPLIETILDLGDQDIYTDAHEYRERVDQMREAVRSLAELIRNPNGNDSNRS